MRFALLLILVVAVSVQAQVVGPPQKVTIEHADVFESIGPTRILRGNVRITQGTVTIQADVATYDEIANRAVLTGGVRITQPGTVITAPRVEYEGNTRLATAPNGVTIVDHGATIRGGWGSYDMNSRRSTFRNGVALNDGKSRVKAGSGEYYGYEQMAIFRGNVRVDTDSGYVTAREITHWRGTQESFAVGNVVLVARRENARLTGDTVRHIPQQGYTWASGRPKLVKIDSAGVDSTGRRQFDTTTIIARRLEALRGGREEYIATDSVRLRRGELEAVAAIARYLPNSDVIGIGPGLPRTVAAADSARAVDSAAAARRENEGVTGARPDRRAVAGGPWPVVWYDQSQLTGDTITVYLAERKVDAIDVLGHAFILQKTRIAERYDQLAATRIIADVDRDTLRRVQASDYASSIYFIFDSEEASGVQRQSGDTITVEFEEGEVTLVHTAGRRTRAEGEYFPENLITPSAPEFRLEGFELFDRPGSLQTLDARPPKEVNVPDVTLPQPPPDES